MASITTRAGKGTPLTNAEVDSNFTNLNDELGTKLPLSGGTLTGNLTVAANIDFTGNGSVLPGHFYTHDHDGTNVYFHVGQSGSTTNKVLNLRVYRDNGEVGLHQFTPDAYSINGQPVLHSGNYSSYALPLSGGFLVTGASSNLFIGRNSTATNYNAVSLNGLSADSSNMGLTGGGSGDSTLYINSPGNINVRTSSFSNSFWFSGANFSAPGAITSGGNNGFRNDVYYSGVRNPIWMFGNATAYGLSYYQGSSGIGGADTIGLHPNGSTTSGGAAFAVTPSASYVNSNVVLHAGNYTSYAAPASHSHNYIPINPDGDGNAWTYADENPTINGVSVGGGQRFGADGSSYEGFLQAKILNAYNGFVNSANGYYVGNYDFGANSNTYSTTQVIDGSGNFIGGKFIALYGNPSDTIDGAPWYGLGGSGNTVHLAGYYGLRLRTASAYMDLNQGSAYYSSTFNAVTLQNNGNQVLHAGNYTSYTASRNGSGYLTPENWIQLNGTYGLYSGTNGAHFYPNDGSYGAWRIEGSRDGWRGINFSNSLVLMMNDNESGHHKNGYGWQYRWYNGTLYNYKNAYGGGTEAIVLDASNYTSYAAPASHDHNGTNRRVGVLTFNGEGGDSGVGSQPTSYGIYQQGGAWTYPYPDLCIGFHTGIKIGAHYSYNGTRFYNNSDWATEIFSVGNGDNNVRAADTIYAAHYRGNANVGGTGEASHHPAGIYSNGTNWLYGTIYTNGNGIYAGGAYSEVTAYRANRANGWFYIDDNYGCGVVGAYSSYRYQTVYAMGDSYKMSSDGTSLANMYGIAWSHPNAGGAAGNLTDHGMLIINAGGFRCAISNSIVASANITAYSDERLKTNWRDMPENYVARLAKVKVGIYDRTDQEDVTQVGVSAQSFQELLPDAIMTAKDEMQTLSVSYGNAALASAVELAKDNVELRARIERLEEIINTLIGEKNV